MTNITAFDLLMLAQWERPIVDVAAVLAKSRNQGFSKPSTDIFPMAACVAGEHSGRVSTSHGGCDDPREVLCTDQAIDLDCCAPA
jgi:hypothetical protein